MKNKLIAIAIGALIIPVLTLYTYLIALDILYWWHIYSNWFN